MSVPVRVRFAPSPTGMLHIGGVRTALFNWLFARHHGGSFILRIDDTDAVRSNEEYLTNILASLDWLGLTWDEGPQRQEPDRDQGDFGPYRQSRRQERYQAIAQQLLAEGKAFHCYCSAEELEAKRQQAARQKTAPRYDGRCLDVTDAQRSKFEAEGRNPAIRFRLPDGPAIVLEDLIRGRVEFPREMLDHFILVRSDGKPVYNFVSAVDEADLKITHVIRGDDHLSNTPKQMLVMEALGLALPRYAHLPQILGLDRSRLSKRRGAPAVLDLREEGFLPHAVINFLVLLGWSYNDKDEIFSPEELVEKFDLARVGSAPAVFDEKKLLWMNGLYIRNASNGGVTEALRGRVRAAYATPLAQDDAYVERALTLVKEGLKTLGEVAAATTFFFEEDVSWEDETRKKLLEWPRVVEILDGVKVVVEKAEPFTPEHLEAEFRSAAQAAGLKFKDYVHPTRFACTGRAAGPSLFHLLEVLGRPRCLARLTFARSLLG